LSKEMTDREDDCEYAQLGADATDDHPDPMQAKSAAFNAGIH